MSTFASGEEDTLSLDALPSAEEKPRLTSGFFLLFTKILVLPLLLDLLDGRRGLDLDVVRPSLFFVGGHGVQRRRRGGWGTSTTRGEDVRGRKRRSVQRGFEENGIGSVYLY